MTKQDASIENQTPLGFDADDTVAVKLRPGKGLKDLLTAFLVSRDVKALSDESVRLIVKASVCSNLPISLLLTPDFKSFNFVDISTDCEEEVFFGEGIQIMRLSIGVRSKPEDKLLYSSSFIDFTGDTFVRSGFMRGMTSLSLGKDDKQPVKNFPSMRKAWSIGRSDAHFHVPDDAAQCVNEATCHVFLENIRLAKRKGYI